MFKTALKAFFRLKRVVIPGCVAFAVLAGLNIYFLIGSDFSYISSLASQSMVSIIAFVFFVFAAYEYVYDIKFTNLSEALSTAANGRKRTYLSHIFVLLFVAGMLSTFILLSSLICLVFLEVGTAALALHALFATFVNYFLVSFLGIMIGTFAGCFLTRLPGYLFCTLCVLLPTQVFRSFFSNINLYSVYDFFNFFSPDLTTMSNGVTGINVQGYRICRILFFIFLFLIPVILSLYKREKIKRTVFLLVTLSALAVCLAVSLMPWSKLDTDGHLASQDYLFYSENSPKTEAADFVIESYDIDLKIRNQLYAEVEMELSATSKEEYIFTLYHGFEISGVEDENGAPLDFKQDGDYFAVESSSNKITVIYSGWNYLYYSNEQGVFLSGSFPYYPRAGYISLTPHSSLANQYVPLICDTVSFFDVEIDSFYDVYSNLDGKNSFSGEADNLTLMGGFFVTDYTVNGTRVVYAYPSTTMFGDKDIIEQEIKALQGNELFKTHSLETVFVTHINNGIVYDDYMEMAGIIGVEYLFVENLILDHKVFLSQMLKLYETANRNFNSMASYGKEKVENGVVFDNFNYVEYACMLMQEAFDKYGASKAIRLFEQYMYDNSDTREPLEFFDDILGEEG